MRAVPPLTPTLASHAGACAQFRPSQPEESMVQLYKAGRVEHMFVLKGTANVAPGVT